MVLIIVFVLNPIQCFITILLFKFLSGLAIMVAYFTNILHYFKPTHFLITRHRISIPIHFCLQAFIPFNLYHLLTIALDSQSRLRLAIFIFCGCYFWVFFFDPLFPILVC